MQCKRCDYYFRDKLNINSIKKSNGYCINCFRNFKIIYGIK